jgi:hypothetical protein
MTSLKTLGQIEVGFRFLRHMGPKFIHGSVTLQFDSLQPYSFKSYASWPSGVNYEKIIRETVEKILLELQGDLNSTSVILKRIEWDDVNSCEAGFRAAAHAATQSAFNV